MLSVSFKKFPVFLFAFSSSMVLEDAVQKWIRRKTTRELNHTDAKLLDLPATGLRIFVCCWNLHGHCPSVSTLSELIRPDVTHDIYVLGFSESNIAVRIDTFTIPDVY